MPKPHLQIGCIPAWNECDGTAVVSISPCTCFRSRRMAHQGRRFFFFKLGKEGGWDGSDVEVWRAVHGTGNHVCKSVVCLLHFLARAGFVAGHVEGLMGHSLERTESLYGHCETCGIVGGTLHHSLQCLGVKLHLGLT